MKSFRRNRWRNVTSLFLPALALTIIAAKPTETERWSGSWAAAQQALGAVEVPAPLLGRMVTIRQFVRLTKGGNRLRLRFSNVFGTVPLTIDAVQLAASDVSTQGTIDATTRRDVRFGGAQSVTIPAGAEYWSDGVAMPTRALASLGISMRVSSIVAIKTGHIASHATSFIASGDHLSDHGLPDALPVEHWFALSGVAVDASRGDGAIVTLGDSITDGSHSTKDENDRWPDRLAERLHDDPRTRELSVLNLGIGGNRVLLDGVGPNALARFDRDVLGQSNVRTLVLLEGVNDLGTLTQSGAVPPAEHAALVARLVQAYQQVIDRAHQHGLRVIGATILPFSGAVSYRPSAPNEADRQNLNRWIRQAGHFDGVIDFDRAVRDPSAPDRLRPSFDCGDHLHPSAAGYRAMADSVPLQLLGGGPTVIRR